MGTKPPEVVEWIKGRVMSCKLRLHHEWPLITVAVCYSSDIKEECNEIESVLSKLSEQPLLVGGDLNGITNVRESTCRSRNVLYWEWLRYMEDRGKLVDCIKVGYKGEPLFTRVRGYKGTSSYLDKWYVSETLWSLICISNAFVANLFKANGTHFYGHQRVGVGLGKAILGDVDKTKGCHGRSTKQI